MRKIALLICGAFVVGNCLQCSTRKSEPLIPDAKNRVANCVIRLNGQTMTTPSFEMNEQIDIDGEMEIVKPTEDLVSQYLAFLVALDHPKAKDIVADSGFLPAVQNGKITKFKGRLKTPQRPGSYELRIFFMDSHQELQAMDRRRLFFDIPVKVRSSE